MISDRRKKQIEKLATAYGFTGEQHMLACRLAEECVRDAQDHMRSILQKTVHFAVNDEITPRSLDVFVYEQEMQS